MDRVITDADAKDHITGTPPIRSPGDGASTHSRSLRRRSSLLPLLTATPSPFRHEGALIVWI
jgi:hypothetical protein